MNYPIRVLHAVGKMDRGGIETWLMNVLRHLDRREVAFDFLVETDRPGAYDPEIRDLGARIIHVERTRRLWSYGSALARALGKYGPFDAVHSHVHAFAGVVLGVAASKSIPVRIAHSHTAMQHSDTKPGAIRALYHAALRVSLKRTMTHGIAVSAPAAVELFGPAFGSDRRVQVLPCAIDYAAFDGDAPRNEIRSALAIPEPARLVGNVGRLDPSKNHAFLLDVFAAAAANDPQLHLALVGGGQLRAELEQRARELGVAARVTFAGVRADVPALMKAMDAFVFPSKYEGLGLVLIEAQAAGLPIVVSDTVPTEAFIAGHWIRRLPLSDAAAWTKATVEAANLSTEQRRPSFDVRFDIKENVRKLIEIYQSAPDARNAV